MAIGGPGAGMTIYILRSDLSPCDPEEEGEIYIGGVCVAAGYWQNPEMTRAKFVPDPFLLGGTMYRSGDRGILRKGRVCCLGRWDDQVKINGYRIELDEISEILKSHSAVQDAAVLAVKGETVGLAAFVIPKGTQSSETDLRDHMLRSLPQFMVPGSITFIPILPITNHGKIDQKALIALLPKESSSLELSGETDMQKIWSEILSINCSELDWGSDFFNLGGNSMHLLRLLHRIDIAYFEGKRFKELFEELKSFWADPSIAQMTNIVERMNHKLSPINGDAQDFSRQ
ncbi:MAG: hypothetical protein EOP10_17335 [Proteobacteria bacterium]|nr:MAG: hypothetical protein EOP10_17335 [Pseudomonadota bacterium]